MSKFELNLWRSFTGKTETLMAEVFVVFEPSAKFLINHRWLFFVVCRSRLSDPLGRFIFGIIFALCSTYFLTNYLQRIINLRTYMVSLWFLYHLYLMEFRSNNFIQGNHESRGKNPRESNYFWWEKSCVKVLNCYVICCSPVTSCFVENRLMSKRHSSLEPAHRETT